MSASSVGVRLVLKIDLVTARPGEDEFARTENFDVLYYPVWEL